MLQDQTTEHQRKKPVAFDMSKTYVLSEQPTQEHFRWGCPTCGATNRLNQMIVPGTEVTCDQCKRTVEFSEDFLLLSQKTESSEAVEISQPKAPVAIGKYPVERFLARGGMGEVWLGRHPSLDIPVAIKLLSSEMIVRNPKYVQRFLKEARIAAQMNHPNMVRIYDSDHQDGMYFIVLEYMDGGDVLQLAQKQGGRLPAQQALKVIISVSEALQEAAKYGIIHRDIKPENIMLTKSGKIKLADLGIAKNIVSEDEQECTFTNMVLGTPAYISPEQALNANEADTRSDIYSLGATFYHLITGSVPFPARSPFHMMYKHVKDPLRPPQELNPELEDNINLVICRMMEKDPQNRYQDIPTLLQDLYQIRDHNLPASELAITELPRTGIKPEEKTKNWTYQYRYSLGVALSALLLVLAVFWGIHYSIRDADTISKDQFRLAMLRLTRRHPIQPISASHTPAPSGNSPATSAPHRFSPQTTPPPVSPVPATPPPVQIHPTPEELAAAQRKAEEEANRQEQQRQEKAARQSATIAKQLFAEITAANPDLGQGIGARIFTARNHQETGLFMLQKKRWKEATDAFQKAADELVKIQRLLTEREQNKNELKIMEKVRHDAVALGAAESPEVSRIWQQAQLDFQRARDAFRDGDFTTAGSAAKRCIPCFKELIKTMPLIAERNRARKKFQQAIAKADLQALKKFAPADFAQLETARRIADAADKDFAKATKQYNRARQILTKSLPGALAKKEQARRRQHEKERQQALHKKWQKDLTQPETLYQQALKVKNNPSLGGKAVLFCQDALTDLQQLRPQALSKQQKQELATMEEKIKTLLKGLSGVPRQGHAWVVPSCNMELVPIASGVFLCGATDLTEQETPVHSVAISRPFWMGKYEVTQTEYFQLMKENPSQLSGDPRLPVENVNWDAATAFCRKLTALEGKAGRLPRGYEYRLPTEAEWEYACRAGTTTHYFFGNDQGELWKYGNYCDAAFKGDAVWRDNDHNDHFARTAPVGSFPANPWGLHDMHGNVAEWCLDTLARYPARQVFDPVLEFGRSEHIFRGGSWHGAAILCRSAKRSAAAPSSARNDLGFRLVLAPIPTPLKRKGWGLFKGN